MHSVLLDDLAGLDEILERRLNIDHVEAAGLGQIADGSARAWGLVKVLAHPLADPPLPCLCDRRCHR